MERKKEKIIEDCLYENCSVKKKELLLVDLC